MTTTPTKNQMSIRPMDKFRGEYIQVVKLSKKQIKSADKEELRKSPTSAPAGIFALLAIIFGSVL